MFFVVGRAKSGTSWLMRIFNAHPEVLCRGEGRFFGRDFIREDFKDEEDGRIQPSSLYRAFLEADYLRAWMERSVWTRDDDAGGAPDQPDPPRHPLLLDPAPGAGPARGSWATRPRL